MFQPEDLAILIPIVALMIPIVALLTKHQQRMAELMHKGQGDNQMNAALLHEIQALRADVSNLRETVNQQALALDDIKSLPTQDIQNRIGENNGG